MAVGFQNSILSGSLSISGSINLPIITSLNTSGELGEIAAYNEVPYVYTSTGWVSIGDNNATPAASKDIEYLVVAGGGGGGGTIAGGGGAGGLLSGSISSVESGSSFTVVVGGGGDGGHGWGTYTAASPGTNSSLAGSSITTISTVGGGLGGDHYGNSSTNNLPGDGGSGGGGGRSTYYPQAGGSGTVGQGNDGGSVANSSTGDNYGSGGGGAGAAGTTAGADADGGVGKQSPITGTSTYYAGGGGGGVRSSAGSDVGEGGSGGGGAGGTGNSATSGTANTGGGGGGAGYASSTSAETGGKGGSGVVILAYDSGSMNCIGGQEGDAGNGRKYHKFNVSSTLYTGDTTDFQIVTNNLYAHYDFANINSYSGTGTTVTDLKGSNNLTITSAPPFVNDNGGGLDFDGSADYAQVTGISYTPHVMDIWFKNDDNIGTAVMQGNYQTMANFGAYGHGFNLGAWSSSMTSETVNMYITTSSGVYLRTTMSSGIHNLVFRWTGSVWKAYIDGTEVTVYTFGSGGNALRAASTIVMGRSDGVNSYEFDGHIYEMRIYTDGLTDEEITQNYNARKDRFGL